jgi:hypothetical protein
VNPVKKDPEDFQELRSRSLIFFYDPPSKIINVDSQNWPIGSKNAMSIQCLRDS